MGLIIGGVATPTEAAALGVFGAVMLSVNYGTFRPAMLTESVFAAVKISSILLLVMCSAVMFSQLLTFAGAPQALGKLVVEASLPLPVMIFIMLALPFFLFMFLDQMAIMLVLIPIYKPVLAIYGVDGIWFWTMFLVVATVGGISPPFGYTLFAMKSAVPNVPINELYKAAWPFVWLICLGIVLMVAFPSIVTFLPGLIP
jgi:TRAP-type C4-dicarboxylate transport system permease large subunit